MLPCNVFVSFAKRHDSMCRFSNLPLLQVAPPMLAFAEAALLPMSPVLHARSGHRLCEQLTNVLSLFWFHASLRITV